jgi:hypothetical protein
METGERERLNIHTTFNSPPIYGQRRIEYQRYDRQSLYKRSKEEVEGKLLKNTDSTLEIKSLWSDNYENR